MAGGGLAPFRKVKPCNLITFLSFSYSIRTYTALVANFTLPELVPQNCHTPLKTYFFEMEPLMEIQRKAYFVGSYTYDFKRTST